MANININTGAIIWSKYYGATGEIDFGLNLDGNDAFNDVIMHSDGYLYGVGFTVSSMNEARSGTHDAWIGKFDPANGDIVSMTQFGAVTYPGVLAPYRKN